jgi:hypothetical protein
LEFEKEDVVLEDIIVPSAKYLIVAGDICSPYHPNFERFFAYVSKYFECILYVTGNHEYYNHSGLSMEEVDTFITNLLSEYPHVHFLNQNSYVFSEECSLESNPKEYRTNVVRDSNFVSSNPLIFIGATLWTHIPREEEDLVSKIISDYKCIYQDKETLLTSSYIRALHEKHKSFLQNEVEHYTQKWLREKKKGSLVVVTHHMPSYSLIDEKYRSYPGNSAFANDMDVWIQDQSHLSHWIYGHTHHQRSSKIGKTKTFVNPKGYPHEETNYSSSFVVSL